MLANISSMMYVVNMAHYTHNLENNLKRVRTTVGLTQSKLAANVGISRQAYSSLEAGRAVLHHPPSLDLKDSKLLVKI